MVGSAGLVFSVVDSPLLRDTESVMPLGGAQVEGRDDGLVRASHEAPFPLP